MSIIGKWFHLRRRGQLSYYKVSCAIESLAEGHEAPRSGLLRSNSVEETWLRREVSA